VIELEWPEHEVGDEVKADLVARAFAELESCPAIARAVAPLFVLVPYPALPVQPARIDAELAGGNGDTWSLRWRADAWALATRSKPIAKTFLRRFLDARASELALIALSDPRGFASEDPRVPAITTALMADAPPLARDLAWAGLVFDWGKLVSVFASNRSRS
jgi:hypothetical protein